MSNTECPSSGACAALPREKNRIAWIDIAKGLGIFFIALGHVYRSGSIHHYLYSFHVPLFFLLSGFTFRSDLPFGRLVRKKFRSILVPYYIASLVSLGIFAVLGRYAGSSLDVAVELPSLGQNLLSILYCNNKALYMKWNLPLWYLPCAFAVELLVWGVDRLCRKGGLWCYALFACLFSGLGLVLTEVLGTVYLPMQLETGFHMVPFFLLGIVVRRYAGDPAKKLKKLPLFLIGLGLIAVGVVLSRQNRTVMVLADLYGSYALFLICALAGAAGWCAVAMAVGKCGLLEFVGNRSLGILLYHKFPVLLFQVAVPWFSGWLTAPDSLPGKAAGVAAAAVSVALCVCGSCFAERFCPFVVGRRARTGK